MIHPSSANPVVGQTATPQAPHSDGFFALAAAAALGLFSLANTTQSLIGLPLPGLTSRSTAIYLGVAVACASVAILQSPSRLRASIPGLILLIAATPSLAIPPNSFGGVATPARVAALVLLPLILAAAVVQTRRTAKFFLVGCSVQLGIVLIWTVLFPASDSIYSDRITASGIDTVVTGSTVAIASCLALLVVLSDRVSRQQPVLRVLLVAVYGLGAFLLLQIEARAAIATLVVCSALVWVVSPISKGWIKASMGGLLAVTLGFFLASALAIERFAAVVREGDTGLRAQLWADGWKLATTYPGGIGWGNFNQYNSLGLEAEYPHNLALQSISEGGWLFFIALTAVVVIAFRRLLHMPSEIIRNALLIILTGTLMGAMFSSDITGSRLLFVALGAGLGLGFEGQSPARRQGPVGKAV